MMSSEVVVRPRPDQAQAFVDAFSALAAEVLANEPGAFAYYLLRSRKDPASYRVVELYRDDAAYQAHRETDHYRRHIDGIIALLAEPPQVEHFDTI